MVLRDNIAKLCFLFSGGNMDRIRIALVGYGNVGQAFARMLIRKEDYFKENFGVEPVTTAISTGRHGGITNA